MTPRSAARIAFVGVGISLFMSVCDSDLQYWLINQLGLGSQASALFNRLYWILRALLSEGSMLLFLFVFIRSEGSRKR